MKMIETTLPDVKVFEPQIYEDRRGFFFESYNQRNFSQAIGREISFVQDNHSKSIKNTLRGLHIQLKSPQAKLIRVISGEIYDVAVDLRKNSPCFGKWYAQILNSESKRMIWIPEGFAHGFFVISDTAEIFYKASTYYDPNDEFTLNWNDPTLAIPWPTQGIQPLLSEKDQIGKSLNELYNLSFGFFRPFA